MAEATLAEPVRATAPFDAWCRIGPAEGVSNRICRRPALPRNVLTLNAALGILMTGLKSCERSERCWPWLSWVLWHRTAPTMLGPT